MRRLGNDRTNGRLNAVVDFARLSEVVAAWYANALR